MSQKTVTIYTDGACTGNPGPGGYCAILEYGEHRREISGGFRRTTNNRMEMMAVIKALEALKEPCKVTVVSDSEYVVNGMTKGWAKGWRAKGWRRQGKTVPNWELWRRMLELCGLKGHRIGGAVISPKHANFIENAGDATTADCLALMSEARRRAREQFGVELEREVVFLGLPELPKT